MINLQSFVPQGSQTLITNSQAKCFFVCVFEEDRQLIIVMKRFLSSEEGVKKILAFVSPMFSF